MSLPPRFVLSGDDAMTSASAMLEMLEANVLDDPVLKSNLVAELKQMSPLSIYKITSFHDSLAQFCRSELDLQVYWAKQYLKNSYPSLCFYTLDNHYLMIYDLLMGAVLYSGFMEEKISSPYRESLIRNACDRLCYPALLVRLQNAVKVVSNMSQPFDDKKIGLLKARFADALEIGDVLAKTYWQLGFVHAGIQFNNLARRLSEKIMDMKAKNVDGVEALFEYAEKSLHLSVEYFLTAYALRDYPISLNILNNMFPHSASKIVFGNAYFDDWDAVLKDIKTWVDEDTFKKLSHNVQVNLAEHFSLTFGDTMRLPQGISGAPTISIQESMLKLNALISH